RSRRSGQAARRRPGLGETDQVEIPDVTGLAVAVEHQPQRVLAAGEADAGLEHAAVGVPVPGVGDVERAGDVLSVDLEMKLTSGAQSSDAELQVVGAGRLYVHAVLEPLAGLDDADGAGGILIVDANDVDAGAGAVIVSAGVALVGVVIGGAFRAAVEILDLEDGSICA